MIKKFWVIRSREKLFTGLAFGISGFLLFYSLLTVLVLEERIPWRNGFFGPPAYLASKYLLLIGPLLALGCCILLHLVSRGKKLPFHGGREASGGALAAYRIFVVGENFLLTLLLAFLQLDKLDTAKGTPGFSPFVWILILVAMAVFAVWSLRGLQLAGKAK